MTDDRKSAFPSSTAIRSGRWGPTDPGALSQDQQLA